MNPKNHYTNTNSERCLHSVEIDYTKGQKVETFCTSFCQQKLSYIRKEKTSQNSTDIYYILQNKKISFNICDTIN